ncbi:hypothetical protein FAUST_4665 [Fusarium austroamericanum]|uniref:Ankyrin n=1 Tax=Fusarium austroamericanum TaxID=282268 RepID=A0AAN6C2M1_FUSAU|nr:hypothetical protein FAUST_4665 [Fusarium austroamericanum]
MEILGAVASALTLVDYLVRTTRGIQRLTSQWESAPAAIIALRTELEDSRETLCQLDWIMRMLDNIANTPPIPPCDLSSTTAILKRKLDETSKVLEDLQVTIVQLKQEDTKECRIFWVRKQKEIQKKSNLLRDSRRDIQESLQILNTQQQHAITIMIRGLAHGNGAASNVGYNWSSLNENCRSQYRSETLQLVSGKTDVDILLNRSPSLPNLAPRSFSESYTSSPHTAGFESSLKSSQIDEKVRYLKDTYMTYAGDPQVLGCDKCETSESSTKSLALSQKSEMPVFDTPCGCIYNVRVRQTRRGESRLFRHLLGSISMGYITVTSPETQCYRPNCQGVTGGSKITLQYNLPSWVDRRVLYSSISLCGFDRHQFTLATSRRVPYAPGNVFSRINSRDYGGAMELIRIGDANIRDMEARNGNSILAAALRHATIRPGFLQFLEFLTRRNVNVDLPNNRGETPWLLAAQLMLPSTPSFMASKELKENLSVLFPRPNWSKLGFNHLHMIISGLRPLDLNEVLKNPQHRSQVNSRDAMGQTPLLLATTIGDDKAVQALMIAGASIESCGPDLLRKAIHARSKACLELLLASKPGLPPVDSRGATLIHTVAAGCDNFELLEPLILADVPLDSLNFHKCTPLSFTPLNDNYNVACILLSEGANINNIDKDGDTPLTEAIRLNAHDCIRLFIDQGANLNISNRLGWGILHFAGAYGDVKTFEILSTVYLSARVWADHEGNTPEDLFRKRQFVSQKLADKFSQLCLAINKPSRQVVIETLDLVR